jgi:hypothetical protein
MARIFIELANAANRVMEIRLKDTKGTAWLMLWHKHKYTQETGFFTEFWISIGLEGIIQQDY